MGFSADWLALRDPADRAARDPALLAAAAGAAGPSPVVMDLGCGTGASLRALGPLLPGAVWRMVDHDPALLPLAVAAAGPGATGHVADLAGGLDGLPWDGVTLVTASALFDLVSADWVAGLAGIAAARGLPVYAALSYDGRMAWDPADADDAAVTAAFNRHQRGDKGFGPALGPDAATAAAQAFRAQGFDVHLAQSDWRLGPGDAALQAELLAGIAAAAQEAGTASARWLDRRAARVGQGLATIGHIDLLALPGAA
jgi:hypothetical protein